MGKKAIGSDVAHAVASLYDAAVGANSWEAAVETVADEVGAQSALFFTPHLSPTQGFFYSHAIDPAAFDAYAVHYHATDIWLHEGLRHGVLRRGRIHFGEELVSREIFDRSEHCNDFLRPLDIYHVIATSIPDNPRLLTPRVNCSLFRPPDRPAFSVVEKEKLRLLQPHIERALLIRTRLEGSQAVVRSLTDVLQHLSTAVVLVRPDGRVAFANRAAEALLACRDGLALGATGLQAASGDDNSALQRALGIARTPAAASEAAANACTISRPSGRRPYQIVVAPVPRQTTIAASSIAGAVAFIIDPEEAPEVPAARIARLLHLTGAEARLAVALAGGASLAEYAERAGITLGTARWTLKQALAKTGTDKQSALIALVLRTAIVRGSR